MKRIYLDNAATTALHPDVLSAMLKCMEGEVGNPSSLHAAGRTAKVLLETARQQVASMVRAEPSEIVFVSGGTEANNMALFQRGVRTEIERRLLAASPAEHQAVLQPLLHACEQGAEHLALPVLRSAAVDTEAAAEMLARTEGTCALVSVMQVNNETGAISDIERLAESAHAQGALFHSDMVQAAGKLAVDLPGSGVDLASFSAHKIHGPQGIGALYVRRGSEIEPLIRGGAQERKRRGGTEHLAAILGFAEACRIAMEEREERNERWIALRALLLEVVLSAFPETVVNGEAEAVQPHILSLTFPYEHFGVDGEALLMNLDMKGVLVSSGSACTAGSFEASHVMRAIGHDERSARSSLRCSFGAFTAKEEVLAAATQIVDVLQEMSGRSRSLSHSRSAMP